MTIYSTAITLFLVMDPIGNIPIFLSILNPVDADRRARIILRECFLAYLILVAFLLGGNHILDSLNITTPALDISGGIILFLIAIKMIFPTEDENSSRERSIGEPFIVPLAIPLVAGPSALTIVTLLGTQESEKIWQCLTALTIAAALCTIILLSATKIRKWLGQKGIIAMERLMGMVLTTFAVQMFLNGIQEYFKL